MVFDAFDTRLYIECIFNLIKLLTKLGSDLWNSLWGFSVMDFCSREIRKTFPYDYEIFSSFLCKVFCSFS